MKDTTTTILLVEDEPADAELLQRAFTRVGIPNPVHVVSNGEEAVAYLEGSGPYSDRAKHPFPRVVVTDLKMPRMDGLQLLRWMRANPEFRVVPVIVFTSSTAQAEVDEAFALGANAYMVKPVELKELERMARAVAEYWRLSLLPSRVAAKLGNGGEGGEGRAE